MKILFQENLGLNKTNNVAISLAKGKFIMRLDADDFLDKNALHLMSKKLLEDDDLALVFLITSWWILKEKFLWEKRHDFEDVEMMDQPAHGAYHV